MTGIKPDQWLVKWNNTKTDYPQDRCIHHLFEAQVEQTPEAVALIYAASTSFISTPAPNAAQARTDDYDLLPPLEQLTYRELNSRANRLAHYLQSLGVGPETLVGLCLERPFDLLALLAVLKAGGAYVPLDPTYPTERLAYVMQDSRVGVLLTQASLQPILPQLPPKVICLDTDWPIIAQQPSTNPPNRVQGDNLAYILYTSGSTGQPKGVQIPHRALTNFLYSMQRQPGLTRHDVVLAITTLAFDIAALELFLPLTVGARIVLVSRAVATDPAQLSNWLAGSGATVLQATPSTWRLLLAAGWSGQKELTILCGGEALSRALAEQLLTRAAAVWNMYGPTETTIWSTTGRLEPGDGIVPLGRPIANTQVYLLDAQLQLVPKGVEGELYIGGHGLARGYLKRPDLTAERFIPDPFGEEAGARLYKTGDVARFRTDGLLEFLGRSDHQVKIRGFRIEIGEIEAGLSRHPAVREAVVMAREDIPGDKRLVAYIIPKTAAKAAEPGPDHLSQSPSSERESLAGELRRFLQERLPDYMVPATFNLLETFPLTPNGKIDRRALPAPDAAIRATARPYSPPQTPIETMLAGLWAEILRLERVGIHDDFFELGGHSLLATQLISRLREACQVELPLELLFEATTIAGLAEQIETIRWAVQNRQAALQLAPEDPGSEREEGEL